MTLPLALLLDALFGEPRWLWSRLPHPAVLMGRVVAALDRRLNHGPHRRARGALALALLLSGAVALGLALQALPGDWIDLILAAILLAQRSLCAHLRAVATGLRQGLPQGRAAVAMIVGRDTGQMDSPAVARAAIESGAENLSDGVIAPAFWFAVAGLPGILAYKALNTADSMIGHRTPRHARFGWAAARADDLANLIPARLTALLIWLPARHGRLRAIADDAALHRSPNAGWPEAAMARALDIALSGPRSYHGQHADLPWVHPTGRRHPGPADIDAAIRILWQAWALALLIVTAMALA